MSRLTKLYEAKSGIQVKGRLYAYKVAEELLTDLRKIARAWDLGEDTDTLIELFETWGEAFGTKLVDLVYEALGVIPKQVDDEPLSPEAYAERLGEGP